MNELFDRYMRALEQTERLPLPELARYQEELLTRLVRHAYEHAPFYRERLRCLCGPNGEPDLSRWNDIPIMTRDDAISRNADMRVANLPEIYGAVTEVRTSGTTGVPLKIARNDMVPFSLNAVVTRAARWFGMNTSRALAVIKSFPIDEKAAYPDGIVAKGWSLADPEAPHYLLNKDTPVEQQLDWLARRRAPYVVMYPTTAMALCHALTREQGQALGIEIVMTGGQTVPDGAREMVADRLGARLVALYGCEEVGAIATECPVAPHYHVAAENVLVEILDDDGRDVRHGERGRVVLTGLYNYAMPFIRYAIGDVALAGTGPCRCGRSLPVISQVEGRTRNAFIFRDGTRIWPRGRLVRQMRGYVPFVQYQLVQLDYDRIELRYVPDGSDRVPDLEGLTAYAREAFHPSVTISIAPMDVLPLGAGGKFEDIISLVTTSPPTPAG